MAALFVCVRLPVAADQLPVNRPPAPGNYHLVLEARPATPFPFLSKFGTVELHVYPKGVRAETIWLNGFSRNGTKSVTVENPYGRMYTEVPVANIGAIVGKLAGTAKEGLDSPIVPPVHGPVAGTVSGIAAQRYRIQFGPEAWIDVWTTTTLGDAPQYREIVQQFVGGISPVTAKAASGIRGVPLYVELNFSHYRKLAIVRVRKLTFDTEGQEKALKVGRLFIHNPLLDSLWK